VNCVLVINSGSSSLKWNLYDVEGEQILAKGLVERIGEQAPLHKYSVNGQAASETVPAAKDHEGALGQVVAVLEGLKGGLLPGGIADLHSIGHRVVHGALAFTQPVLIDEAVKAKIRECFPLAPLHNPPNLMGIEACGHLMPAVPQVAVFDTAFHQTMPERAYLYALPHGFAQDHQLRRYGFHGISHQFVSEQASRHLGGDPTGHRVVTCHLGNGASITAVKGGRSVDTSMGLTPLEGLVMGTRCGDLDAGVVLHLARALGMTIEQVDTLLNRKSGMLGLSGLSNDMREVEDAAVAGNLQAKLALEVYCYRLRKYIGAYAAALDGLDAIVFTAGVGEHSPLVREAVCRPLGWLGVELDATRNEAPATHKSPLTEITVPGSRVKVLVIPTNEELMIAREAAKLTRG
jgi:acetate kinase